jgi:hypothetical protein
MYKINTKWNSFVLGVINNVGWILVFVLSLMILLFSQLGTWHIESGNLSDLYNSYGEYGSIHQVKVINPEGSTTISIRSYYSSKLNLISDDIVLLTEQAKKYIEDNGAASVDDDFYINILKELQSAQDDRQRYILERDLISSGVLKGISLDNRIDSQDIYDITWIGEYTIDKVFYLAVTDFYSWMMALLIAFSSVIIKVQGSRTGKNSGMKMVWKTTLRHATLSEKIAPRSKDAELICQEMNADELRLRREDRLRYVALKYEDVFRENGTFLNNPNFVKVEVSSYKTLKGKTKYKENKYQKALLIKQKKIVEQLKLFRIKEAHTYILLESKAEAKERFDFGESLKARERKAFLTNVLTSMLTVLPMFGAVSLFVLTENQTNLLIGLLGMVFNLVALLFNMFASFDYIINTWAPNILKKCDTLLVIGNQLGITDDKDNNWDALIEKETLATNKN